MRLVLTALLALMLPFAANAQEREIQRADNAVRVLSEILAIPEESIPERLLREAEAIAVMPDVVKAGLVFGGRGGKGLMAVRGSDGTWSNPTFITLGGGSFGFQAGVQSADVVLVFRNRRGVDNIVNGKFTLGADASVAAGPVGRSAQASTDGQLKAEIYSYSRARGLFAGIALDGAVIAIDNRANRRVYGRDVTARMILENRVRPQVNAVVGFRDKLEEASAQAAR
ncbi:lipid-binding SYLF domain-containing protein [Silanimonas sp.]|jgi:lipid-binding SYLF domain-containing protein|uniref:lipid-binding SYLF domain-containing protein n=1 Tax=Silanimonas sp. TaxID=1929290 RepID=UPI0022BFE361|nr:lipid-binding SYLF domain-containing protein [Silanimonas sp.]MCZ8164602.1 lipid-binding SYLF domain-containing protein [Silanimonas sp.]